MEKSPHQSGRSVHQSGSMLKREAQRLASMHIASTGVTVGYDPKKDTKTLSMPKGWPEAHPDTCVATMFENTHNGLIIVTGQASDLFVVDIDVGKVGEVGILDGLATWRLMLERYGGLPDDIPTQQSGSGGLHFFFSMSKSLHAGMVNPRNDAKIFYEGERCGIDTRGDRGCVVSYPTSYRAVNGCREYTWLSPIRCPADLPACPDWLIAVLNKHQEMKARSTRHPQLEANLLVPTMRAISDEAYLLPLVEEALGCKVSKTWPRQRGFDFCPCDRSRACPNCSGEHDSNQYMVRSLLDTIFTLRNYSSRCINKIYGWEEHAVIKRVLQHPTGDQGWLELLKGWERCRGCQLGFEANGRMFYEFDGICWEELNEYAIMKVVRQLGYHIIDQLVAHVGDTVKKMADKDSEGYKKMANSYRQLQAARLFIQKSSNIFSVLNSARQDMYDPKLATDMNARPDLLAVGNGVLDLRTGTLRAGQPDDYLSFRTDVEFRGIDLPTPTIDAFLWSVFEDADVVDFLQMLLGYGITGHMDAETWLIMHGGGSNGKSVLNDLLETTLGKHYHSMNKACLIKGERPVDKNAPTPYLADLAGKRVAVCDEIPENAVIDDDTVKRATTRGTMEARHLNKNFIQFTKTHFSVLLTNHKPKFNCDDEGLVRRTMLLPFRMAFKHPHEYDPTEETHRPIDTGLSRRLLENGETLEEMLAWLVKGAVRWYEADRKLPPPPAIMQQAKQEYIEENDALRQFIDEYCEVGRGFYVETTTFKSVFESRTDTKVGAKMMASRMQKRGFKKARLSVGKRESVFEGLQLITSTTRNVTCTKASK